MTKPRDGSASPFGLEGHLEELHPDRIAGWVWSRTICDAPVFVTARLARVPLFTVRANQYRADLAAEGKRFGACGFVGRIPPDALDAALGRVRDGAALAGRADASPLLELFVHPVANDRILRGERWLGLRPQHFRALLEPHRAAVGDPPGDAFVGLVRRVDARAIAGWCARTDLHRSSRRVPVALYVDGAWADTVFARPPILSSLGADGASPSRLGLRPLLFRFPTPRWLRDGRLHTIAVALAEDPRRLIDRPLTIRIDGEGDQDPFAVPPLSGVEAAAPPPHDLDGARGAYEVWRSAERRPERTRTSVAPVTLLVETSGGTDAEALGETLASIRARSVRPAEVVVFGPNAPGGRLTLRAAVAGVSTAYVGLCFAGDRLASGGLRKLAQRAAERPDATLLYGDDDIRDLTGRRHEPRFKTRYCPDRALTDSVLGGLCLVRTDAARAAFEASPAPVDRRTLAIKVARAAGVGAVEHVAAIVCHRRLDPTRKPPKLAARRAAFVEALLAGEGHRGHRVEAGDLPRVVWPRPARMPPVSVIIPTRDMADLFAPLVHEVRANAERSAIATEIVIVDNESAEPAALAALRRFAADGVRIVRACGPFNFSLIKNRAATAATGDVLVFMNNDLKGLSADLLDELVRQVLRPDVGVVGGRLSYPDGTNQHCGIGLGIGGVGSHVMKHHATLGRADHGRFRHVQTVSAVTGALMAVRRATFEAVAGFEPALAVAYNDVDLCLRVRARLGLRTLYTPHAHAYHLESATRGLDVTADRRARLAAEKAFMRARWGSILDEDPWLSPHHSLSACDLRPAPPRTPHTALPAIFAAK